MQRKPGKPGKGLGKTTGWIHRASLNAKGVTMLGGMRYKRITPDGLVVERDGAEQTLPADTIVLCTGQEPLRDLAEALPGPMSSGVRMSRPNSTPNAPSIRAQGWRPVSDPRLHLASNTQGTGQTTRTTPGQRNSTSTRAARPAHRPPTR